MTTKKISLDEVDKFFEYDVFIPSRTIYMGSVSSDYEGRESGVDHFMAERTIKALHILDRLSPKPPGNGDITIVMNNPGGDWYHGMAIYDAIKSCSNHVSIHVMGYAMSMGSIILQAADERVMYMNSRLMIHYGTSGGNFHTKTVQKWAEEDRKICDAMEKIYLSKIWQKHPNFSQDKLKEMCNFDTFLNAQEAVDLGLADRVEQVGI
jgi:ATP-dependent Clp endopeptidase proteolytic subunit ClpP